MNNKIIEVLDDVVVDGHSQRSTHCSLCNRKLEIKEPSLQLTIGVKGLISPVRIDICQKCISDTKNKIERW